MTTLFDGFLAWVSAYRLSATLAIALFFWVAAYGLYFRRDIERYLRRHEEHSWQVDMVTKTTKRGVRPSSGRGKRR